MRIVHVIGRLDFADGGPPVVATRLAAAQGHLGHEVTIACRPGNADSQTDQQLAHLAHADCVKLTRLSSLSRLKPIIAAADVVHLHNVWEPILLRAASAAREMGKPYFVLPNGMLDPWSLSQKKWKKRVAMALGYRRMLNGAAALHMLNENERDLIAPLKLTAPAIIIPNGVNLEEIDPLPPRGTYLEGRRYLLFLSRLHYKKGLDYLADAFSALAPRYPDVDLVVAGPDGGERDNFAGRIAAAGLNQRVHIVGPLYGKEKIAALAGCECFVLPSRQEGFSLAILEAMAAGATVVISENCHFAEVATAGAGEVVALNAAALADALGRMVSDPNRGRFGAAGRKLVETRYTWDRVAQRTIDAYQAALARPGN